MQGRGCGALWSLQRFFCTRSEDEGSKAARTKVERPRKAPRWGAGGWEGQISWPRGDRGRAVQFQKEGKNKQSRPKKNRKRRMSMKRASAKT